MLSFSIPFGSGFRILKAERGVEGIGSGKYEKTAAPSGGGTPEELSMLPFRYAIRNEFRDPTRLAQAVLGSALVALRVMGATAFNQGMINVLSTSGDPRNVILLGAGSEESLQRSEIPDCARRVSPRPPFPASPPFRSSTPKATSSARDWRASTDSKSSPTSASPAP